jgi:hypothetical protein
MAPQPSGSESNRPGPRMDDELRQAYAATEYRVEAEPPRVFRLGRRDAEVAAWLAESGHKSMVFVTAWNPYSRPLERAENDRRQHALAEEVAVLGLQSLPGRGADPQGEWQEESLCVFDVDPDHVDAWMRRYEQNAVVWVDEAGGAELRMHPDLRESGEPRAES